MISYVSNSGHRYNFFPLFSLLIYVLNLLTVYDWMVMIVYGILANDTENKLVVIYTLVQIDWEFLNKQTFLAVPFIEQMISGIHLLDL